MKRFLLCLTLFAAANQNCLAAVEWFTDLPTAMIKARAEHKTIMLDFTGSDWCGWCMKLKSEVFDQPAFEAFAGANLVLVELDFPRHKAQSAAEQQANAGLAAKYNVEGYPTLVFLNSTGKEVSRGGYAAGGIKTFIANLQGVPGIKPVDISKIADLAPGAPKPPAPIPHAEPLHYGELTLKGISGAGAHRLALINNQTFGLGETAKVRVQNDRIELTCQEIRDDSVLVLIAGKPTELKLAHADK